MVILVEQVRNNNKCLGFFIWDKCTGFFYMGTTFILVHEMDAVRRREWRIFPGLSLLNDQWGLQVFMYAHVPLFFWFFWGILGQPDSESFIWGFDLFYIVHMGLHLLLLMHPKNEFKDTLSWIIISGAAISGALDIWLAF